MATKITITRDEFRDVVCGVLSDIFEKQLEDGMDAMVVSLDNMKNITLLALVEKRLFDNKEDK